jgi:hypothetical protein
LKCLLSAFFKDLHFNGDAVLVWWISKKKEKQLKRSFYFWK